MTREAPDARENHFLRRARNHEVRRSRRNRTVALTIAVWSARLTVLSGVAFGAASVWRSAIASPRYTLRKIHVVGMAGAPRHELQGALGRFRGHSLLRLSLGEVAEAARRHPRVWEASVKRLLPDAVEVKVRERIPVALALRHGTLLLVDHEGALLGPPRPEDGAELDLPVVTGLPAAGDAADGRTPAELLPPLKRGLAALSAMRELAPEMLASVSEVNVQEGNQLRVVLRTPARTLWLTDDGVRDELSKYFRVKDAIGARLPTVRHVDLRFKSRVIVRDGEVG